MKLVPVAAVCDVNPRLRAKLRPNDEVAFVGMADLDDTLGVAQNSECRIYADVSKGYTAFENGDLLVAKITPCFENRKIGQANTSTAHAFGSTEFHVLRPNPDVLLDRYLLHLLRHDHVLNLGEMRMTGAGGQRRVPARLFDELEIPLPPLDEQRRIAAILDAADALRTKRRQALAKLDTLTQAIFIDMFGDPVGRDLAWPQVAIGDVIESASYGTSKKAGKLGRHPILRMGNLTSDGQLDLSDLKYVDLAEKELDRHQVRQGDVLFNRTNSAELVGKTALYDRPEPMAYAGYLIRLRPNGRTVGEYISTFMNLPTTKLLLKSMCKSIVGMANINAKEVSAITIPLPPVGLQHEFAQLRAALRERSSVLTISATQLDHLFASLQQRAFNGEL